MRVAAGVAQLTGAATAPAHRRFSSLSRRMRILRNPYRACEHRGAR
jgi:hypothetical protein